MARPKHLLLQSQSAGTGFGGVDHQSGQRGEMLGAGFDVRCPLSFALAEVELASNSPSARIPVSEVRMSCAKTSRAPPGTDRADRVAPRRRTRRRSGLRCCLILARAISPSAPLPSQAQHDTPRLSTKLAGSKTTCARLSAIFTVSGLPPSLPAKLPAKSDPAPDLERHYARGAQFAQARRTGRLRKFLSGLVENKLVMVVGRLRQSEQRL